MLTIRPHTLSDATAIGTILADGWRQAYSAFMPEGRLKTHADRAYRHREIAEFLGTDFDPGREALLVAESEGRIVGFAHLEIEAEEAGRQGIINLLYVSPDAQQGGVGRQLVAASAEWFGGQGVGPILVSAFAQNPFSGFYRHIGGVETRRRTHDVLGTPLESITFSWPDAAALVRGATS